VGIAHQPKIKKRCGQWWAVPTLQDFMFRDTLVPKQSSDKIMSNRADNQERLQKILARSGFGSRRACEDIIFQKRVSVDGKIVDSLGAQADPANSDIRVDGKPIALRCESLTIMINKPTDVVCTMKDTHGRKTIVDLLTDEQRAHNLFPVGRLDKDTTGLILMTNDGDLGYRLTHPKYEITKWYEAEVKGHLSEEAIRTLKTGTLLEDGLSAPAEVEVKGKWKYGDVLVLGIHEGRKRQVRRMLASVKSRVRKLKRFALGSLELGDLKEGESRRLTADELNRLREEIGLSEDPPIRHSE